MTFGKRSGDSSSKDVLAPFAGRIDTARSQDRQLYREPQREPASFDRAGFASATDGGRADSGQSSRRSVNYYDIKSTIFNALIDAIDLTQLSQIDREVAREEIRDIVSEIITLKDVVMSVAEQEDLLEDICNDVLGFGPLERCLQGMTSRTSWSTAPA